MHSSVPAYMSKLQLHLKTLIYNVVVPNQVGLNTSIVVQITLLGVFNTNIQGANLLSPM